MIRPLLLSSLLAALSLCGPSVVGQDPTPPAEERPGANAAGLVAALRDAVVDAARAGGDAREAAEERVQAAIAAVVAAAATFDHEQAMGVVRMLGNARRFDECVQVCERLLDVQEDPSGLLDLLGISHMKLAQLARTEARMRAHAAAAADAFTRARQGRSVTVPAHTMRWQALMIDCRFDEALADYDAVSADGRFRDALPDATRIRPILLLCAGRYEEALALLEAQDLDDAVREETAYLRIRALILAGRHADAVEQAAAAWEARRDDEAMGWYAEALGAAGRRDEALALLRAHPVEALPDEAWNETAVKEQSRATLEYLLGLDDVVPGQLYLQLAQHLGHGGEVVVTGGEGDRAEELQAVTRSPRFIAATCRKAPSSPKNWGNDLLFLACVVAPEPAAPEGMAAGILSATLDADTAADLEREDAKQRAIEILRSQLFLPDQEGVVTALLLARRL